MSEITRGEWVRAAIGAVVLTAVGYVLLVFAIVAGTPR